MTRQEIIDWLDANNEWGIQKRLAVKAGLSKNYLSEIKSGRRKKHYPYTLRVLSKAIAEIEKENEL